MLLGLMEDDAVAAFVEVVADEAAMSVEGPRTSRVLSTNFRSLEKLGFVAVAIRLVVAVAIRLVVAVAESMTAEVTNEDLADSAVSRA